MDPDPEYHRLLTEQIKAIDTKWTKEFRRVNVSIHGIRAAQDRIQAIHSDQATSIAALQREAALIHELKEEVGRLKPLTKEEQQALGQLVSKQLANQIVHQWLGSLKGKLIGAATAGAIVLTLVSSLASLFRHGF